MKESTSFEEQKGTRYIRENVFNFGIIVFSCLSSAKPCLIFLLNCFVREIKAFYQSSLGNEVDFRDVSPNIYIKKVRHGFLDQRVQITMTSISFCHWKTLVPFCFRKKRPENAFFTLIVTYRKSVQTRKLGHSKQQ